jgi:hypothetical protein
MNPASTNQSMEICEHSIKITGCVQVIIHVWFAVFSDLFIEIAKKSDNLFLECSLDDII